MRVEYYPFANVNNTIRARDGKLHARVSDLLQGAPRAVLDSIANILLSKIYRLKIEQAHLARYRKYVAGRDISAKAHLVRQMRGRKRISSARGSAYHLEEIFEQLNKRFFHGLLARPQMTWSAVKSRRRLAHYDPSHNAIVVSRIFDHPAVPRCAVDYIVYHEMLHLKHPVKLRGSRRCVHGEEFLAEERLFPQLREAKAFLKTL
jgi:predicted metal-dependent hydrolase